MGEQNIEEFADDASRQAFMKSLLEEVRALDAMLDKGMVESGVSRIGAEQEMFLVNSAHKPALTALDVIDELGDERFTHELGLFNIEANLSVHPGMTGLVAASARSPPKRKATSTQGTTVLISRSPRCRRWARRLQNRTKRECNPPRR